MKRLSLIATCLLLAACGRDAPEPEDETQSLAGELHYLERIVMPPGSWIEIELIDEDSDEVLALERIEDTQTPPFTFELDVPAERWRSAADPLVYFTLYLPDGSPRFSAEYRPAAGDDRLPPVRLAAVDMSEDDPEPMDESDWMGWRCGEIPADLRHEGAESATLALPWRDVQLASVEAASGARYQGEDHEFWSRGSEQAQLTLPGEDAIECVRSESLSPWTLARQRGVVFRAAGQEPGWLLEVSGDDAPVLELALDYGSHELRFEEVETLPDGAGYIAEAPGNHAEISLEMEDCQDTMSGWVFPVQVEMVLNDMELSACGRAL